jgi:hypothetical protein
MSINFSSSIHLNSLFFKEKVFHALTVQNKKTLAIASGAFVFLAAGYLASSYYFRAKNTRAPIEKEKVFMQLDAQVDENHIKPTHSTENIPADIWYKIIAYSRQGMASVCTKFKDIQDQQPRITALLFEAHAHHLPSIEQVLNQEVGLYVRHLTLQHSADLQLTIKTCPNCQILHLSNTDITDADLKDLADRYFTHLISLNLNGCKRITDQGLKHLQALTSLQSLDLSGCKQITDQGLEHLKALTSLQSLDLNCCNQITDQGLEHLKALTSLQSLGLGWCNQITDQGLEHLKALTSLQSLDLDWCEQITDQGLVHLQALTSLQSLDLSDCEHITDQGLVHLQALTSLQSLDLSWCKQITDQGLVHLQALTSLQSLDLCECEQMTDHGLKHLQALTSLQSLDLRWCKQITNQGLEHLQALTSLQSLDLDWVRADYRSRA